MSFLREIDIPNPTGFLSQIARPPGGLADVINPMSSRAGDLFAGVVSSLVFGGPAWAEYQDMEARSRAVRASMQAARVRPGFTLGDLGPSQN